jgi:hypothetical protein
LVDLLPDGVNVRVVSALLLPQAVPSTQIGQVPMMRAEVDVTREPRPDGSRADAEWIVGIR